MSTPLTSAKRVGPHRAGFGESAFWSPEESAVWWLDLHGRALLRTREDGETDVFKTPGFPANNPRAIVPARAGKLIAALDDRLTRFDPASGDFSAIASAHDMPEGHVFNDATVDSEGRLIIGTVRAAGGDDYKGRILSITAGEPARVLADGLCTANGLAFSPDGRTVYFSDSHHDVRKVWRAAYDPRTGMAGPRDVFVDFKLYPGRPDGAAIDNEGGYWIAALEDGCVHRFLPNGQWERSVRLPVAMPSRPCFGGRNMDSLYVTTAGTLRGADDGAAGSLFVLGVPFIGRVSPTCIL